MSDAEGIRNLVGTGIVQLIGGFVTAVISLGILFYINWRLTTLTIVLLAAFGVMMALAFKKLRPIFRKRSEINAEVTGRLGESIGGVRIVKVYTAEEREEHGHIGRGGRDDPHRGGHRRPGDGQRRPGRAGGDDDGG
jgi:subfamily B ATP-binding cassette protein MsbA